MSLQLSSSNGGIWFVATAAFFVLWKSPKKLVAASKLNDSAYMELKGYSKPRSKKALPGSQAAHTSDPTVCVTPVVEENGAASMKPVVTLELFKNTVQRHGSKPALALKRKSRDGVMPSEWQMWTFKEYWDQSACIGRALMSIGLGMHDTVNIVGFNSPEWLIANNGCMMAGVIPAGVYITSSPESCFYISEHSRAQVLFVDSNEQLLKYAEYCAASRLPHLKAIVVWGNEAVDCAAIERCAAGGVAVLTWEQFMALGKTSALPSSSAGGKLQRTAVTDAMLAERTACIKPGHCVTLIYTSGTTGPPKAVMLSHDNVTWTCHIFANEYVTGGGHGQAGAVPGRIVSYLPLSHVAAQMIDIHYGLYSGSTTYFAQPDALKGSLSDTLKSVRPTVFFGVPRVWEKMEEKLKEMGRSSTGLKKSISDFAKGVGAAHCALMQHGARGGQPWGYALAKMVVFSKVKEALGLDKCLGFYTAAAPIAVETLQYFASLDIPVWELFGQSECTGPHTSSRSGEWKLGACGRPLPGTHTKIAEGTGELCYKGRHIFMGYMYNPEKTAEAIDADGYLHSGDVATLDADEDPEKPSPSGYMRITGRIKELIITAGGENVAPALIEEAMQVEMPALSNVLVVGDKRKYLAMLVSLKTDPDPVSGLPSENLSSTALHVGSTIGSAAKTTKEAAADPKWAAYITEGMNRANTRAASNAQKVQKWAFLESEFTEKGGDLTPTLKVKRNVVNDKHIALIESLY